LDQIILDMDSSVSPTYGNQEDSAYNGCFECTCYHPLFCFNQYGDVEQALLRNRNVHSADDWQSLLSRLSIVIEAMTSSDSSMAMQALLIQAYIAISNQSDTSMPSA